ncbi:MAG: DUF3482 domain-containing protein, partial [Proteobacteria bacterium]
RVGSGLVQGFGQLAFAPGLLLWRRHLDGAHGSIEVAAPQEQTWREGKLPEALNKARAYPQWSSLNGHKHLTQREREEQIEVLARQL